MSRGFSGTFSCPLDEKNRAVLPQRLREFITADRLRDGFVITQGFEGCLLMFLRDEWRHLMARVEKLPFTDRRGRIFKRFFLAPALEVEVDRVGRVMLVDSHREIAGIDREAIFNGMGGHIEVWSPGKWRKFQTENLGEYEQAAQAVLGFGPQGNPPPAQPGPAGTAERNPGEEEAR